ncbi:hypothetical protein [Kitasatospora sp. GP82]|uniref:alpha/beta fold hydrolase n=1 Tax=Kitasatospora sp. GP82 TaxID=3035089 RepID=UPI0024732262|nr:hypothetical protein [Kitasatospora sp. GP82]MDH6125056.1 pimeloyl-ACP methyl ester carboxylesterase [Kitasatospora sp. GP82]
MPRSEPIDGFRLGHDRSGSGDPVILLHGWPGDRTDYRESSRCWPTPVSRGYTRRDPSSAAAYFARVGRHGPFWELPEA